MASTAAVGPAATGIARPPNAAALWAIALAGCAAAALSFAFSLTSEAVSGELGEPLVIAILNNWITVSYVLCGLLAWWRRPASRFGPLMIAASFASFLPGLSWTTSDVPFTIGQALDLLPPVLFLHVFLAYPSGRLRGRFERTLVAVAYVTAIGLELVRMTLGGFGPHNLLEVAPNPGAALTVMRVQLLAVSAFCLCGVGILAARRRRGGRPLRRSLALLIDAFAVGLVMIAFLFVSAAFGGPLVAEIRWATFATLGLAPVAFLFGLLHSRLARSALGDLILELRADLAPAALRDALARALRDPSLTLAYWLPRFQSWADVDGHPVELPRQGDTRATTLIDRDGEHVAALLHDPALRDEPELLDAVRAAAGIALENGRLHAELGARLDELKGSRTRVIEAAQKERQRLERNLHDGAQQRLVALSLELTLLEARFAAEPEAKQAVDQARRGLAESLAELRELARGIHPAVLTGHGLAVALESLAARSPVPISLDVSAGERVPEAVEVAAYYLVSESLTNVAKYASASSASVAVSRANGELVVEIVDDGVGGADSEAGSGLRGLADRVEALDGQLRIWSPQGGGTRVRAEIPCAERSPPE